MTGAKYGIDFERVMLNMPEALLVENSQHEIVWMNDQARQLLNVGVGQQSIAPTETTEAIASGLKKLAVRKVKFQDRTLECKSHIVDDAKKAAVLSIFTDVTLLEELLAELARRQEQQQRELRALERLSAGSLSGVSAALYGAAPLRESVPEVFDAAAQRYADLLDLALEEQAYKTDRRVSEQLKVLAGTLGAAGAGPRDLIDIHSSATKTKMRGVAAQKAQAYLEEGRLMVLKLMGNLASYYRNYSFGASRAKSVSPAEDQGAAK